MASRAKHAVVVEDDRGVRQLLELVLQTEGWTCDSGDSIEAVIGKVADASVLVLDHHLPGMTGLDVLAGLRDLGVDVPVVMLTGDPAARERAELLGVRRFLLKPFDLLDLLEALRAIASDEVDPVDLRDRAPEPQPAAERPWFASR